MTARQGSMVSPQSSVETTMGNESNQGSDRQNEKAQPGSPVNPDDLRPKEKKLGDDPESEGGDDESLPEGSNQSDLHSDPSQGRRPGQDEDRETRDRRGDGSEPPSNVRREDGAA
jgi:hypothetical protein